MRFYIFLILISWSSALSAQLINDGGSIIIVAGASLSVDSTLENIGTASLINEGNLQVKNDLKNLNGSTLRGNGDYFVGEDWVNNTIFEAGTSTVIFDKALDGHILSGGVSFYQVKMQKGSGFKISLLDDVGIKVSLDFDNDNNHIFLGDHQLFLNSSAPINGFSPLRFVVTNGNGQLVKSAMSNFTFPIGFTTTTYNPLVAIENGTQDDIGVRCLENALADGNNGSILNDVVMASWELSEASSGGSLLDLTAQWAASDEQGSFDRNNCGLSLHDGSNWDLTQALQGAASGSDPYTISRNGISDMGILAVGGQPLFSPLLIDLRLLLEGPYNSSGEMHDFLRQSSLIPNTEPFTNLGYTHTGGGGGETIDPAILNVTGSDAIVDWVFVEIRSGLANTSTIATRAALLQQDGDIVDVDGLSSLDFAGIPAGNYYVLIRPRNHLGVISANSLALSPTSTLFDLATDDSNALGTNLSLKDLGDGFFALYSGDFDANGQVQNTDATQMILTIGTAGYLPGDIDMNGQVQNSELQNILIPNIGKGIQFDY